MAEPTTSPTTENTSLESTPLDQLATHGADRLDELARVRIAHEAMMLQDAQQTLKNDRDTTRRFRQGMLTDVDGQPMGTDMPTQPSVLAGMEDMINLGTITLNLGPPPQVTPAPLPPPVVPATPVVPGTSTEPVVSEPTVRQFPPPVATTPTPSPKRQLLKTAAAVGIALATGGAGGFLLPMVVNAMKPAPTATTPTVAPKVNPESVRYDIRVHPPIRRK